MHILSRECPSQKCYIVMDIFNGECPSQKYYIVMDIFNGECQSTNKRAGSRDAIASKNY